MKFCAPASVCVVAMAALALAGPAWADGGRGFPGAPRDASAYSLAPGQAEVGLFGPLRYGLSEGLELSAHPLWFFVVPHASLKARIWQGRGVRLATRHTVVYPTFLFGLLSREGAGGVLSVNAEVPHILALSNELLGTHELGRGHALTTWAGVTLAPRFGDARWETIDLPVVYPRTVGFHTWGTFQVGADVAGPVVREDLGYALALRAYLLPETDGNYALEQTASLHWQVSQGVGVQAGYLLSWGRYPFGEELRLFPSVDVKWGFGG